MDNKKTLINPAVLIEVLSPATRDYDRGEKFRHYRSITHLVDYLLIDSERCHVEHFHRLHQNQWLFHEYHHPECEVWINTLDIPPTLSEIYESIDF